MPSKPASYDTIPAASSSKMMPASDESDIPDHNRTLFDSTMDSSSNLWESDEANLLPERSGAVRSHLENVSNYKWWLVLPAISCQFFVIGLTVAIVPDLTLAFFGDSLMLVNGIFECLSGVFSFFVSPIMGALSDRYGRRKVMVFCALATNLQFASLLCSSNMWLYQFFRIIGGLTHSFMGLAFAFMADSADLETRPKAFGLASVTFSLSMVVGSAIGAIMKPFLSLTAVWLIACGIVIGMVTYTWVVIPDFVHKPSAIKERLAHVFSWDTLNPFKTLLPVFTDSEYIKLGVATFFSALLYFGFVLTLFIYTTQYMDFDTTDRSILMGLSGSLGAFSGFFLRPIMSCLGPRNTVLLGVTAQAFTVGGAGLAHSKAGIYIAASGNVIGGLTFPAMNSIVSAICEPDKQGSMQGSMMGIKALGESVAPLLFGYFITGMAKSGKHHAGLAYTIGSVAIVPALIAIALLRIRVAAVPVDEEKPISGRSLEMQGEVEDK